MKKITAIILIIVLLASQVTGCKKKNKGTDKNGVATTNGENSDGLNNADAPKVEAPKQAPVGVWDIPVPEINPLGAQGQYTQTSYSPAGSHNLNYIKNFAEYEQAINGDVWSLSVGDNSSTALEALKTYALSLGADVMDSQYDDRLIFSVSKDGESIWWGDALMQDEGYELSIVKQLKVPVGKEVTIDTAASGTEENKISFVTQSSGKKFQTLNVKITQGEFDLAGIEEVYTTALKKHTSYRQTISSKKANSFVLDNIPQGEGIYNWEISWDPAKAPGKITFMLEESYDIPYVKKTDELGALKVTNVPFGSVVVEPAQSISYEYTDGFSTEADLTPEGDSLFWLPPGLWNVYLTSEDAGFTESLTRMVPVSSGEMTQVTVPDSTKSAYLALSSIYSSAENATGSITITKAIEKDGQGVISLKLEDPGKRDIFPDKSNTTIMEGGKKAEITDITRTVIPPSVVLVLDSSGSMEKSMQATLKAAADFIKGLPDKSFVKVIDFNNKVNVLSGDTKENVIKNLSKIKAGGYTVLFDAAEEGLSLLEGKNRPALVVFSDGADSSTDGSGKGSSATKDGVINKAKNAEIPIYTIGFGEKPDTAALKKLANNSGGHFYSAKDDKALAGVFSAINSKFGNSFVMTYNRPKESDNADTPVVSMVIDASASMDEDPAEEGCGYRMDKVKALFHSFITKIPDGCLMQLMDFQTTATGGNIIKQEQITTTDKAKLLQGLGEMEASGGTPILDALRLAYESLQAVPSNNKVIVFLTDAALEVNEEEQELFTELLGKIKEDNITVLFVGMGVNDKETVFANAAQTSGGRYVISEDPNVLNSTLEEILGIIKEKKASADIPITISINDKISTGESLNYVVNSSVNFSVPPKSGNVIAPEPVEYITGIPMKRYDTDVAALVTGNSIPSRETILTLRELTDAQASNKAMNLSVNEMYLFSRFQNLQPNNMQFLALKLDLKNIQSDKIQYQIPNISSHFYVNVNNAGMYPASDATWLTESPLSAPGNYEVNVYPDKDTQGILMFVVPDVPITQLSLHFYDASYGHINIPIIGTMSPKLLELKKLPTQAPVNIADSFTMKVTSSLDVSKLDTYKAPDNTSFRVIEADMTSKVQALLDINPGDRLWMKTSTAAGPLMVKMSDITAYTPFGFMKPVMLGPGSVNKVRMVYPIANSLAGAKTEIFGDISNGSLSIPVLQGTSYGNKNNNPAVSQNGVKVRVNQLTALNESIANYSSYWVVADITVMDEKDGFGTSIPSDFFKLVRDGYELDAEDTSSTLEPDLATGKLLYGIDGDWGVFDNSERRGFLLFMLPDTDSGWTLKSPYLDQLNVPVKNEKFANAGLLTEKPVFDNSGNEEFEAELEKAVEQAVLKYDATKSASGDTGYKNTVSIEKGDGTNNIPVPMIVYHGAVKIKAAKTIEDATALMQGLKCILNETGELQYSPEAVVTQGWGSQWDLANLALGLIAKSGYVPSLRAVNLTESGRGKLNETCGIDSTDLKSVPGVSYLDKGGTNRIYVIPFMKDISELKGLVYLSSAPEELDYDPSMAKITVSVKAELDEATAQSRMNDIGAALGGGEDGGAYYDYIELLSKDIPLSVLCNDAVEIGYMKAGNGTGLRYAAAISTPYGIEPGTGVIDTGSMKMQGLKIEVALPGGNKVHEVTLQQDEELDKIVQTIGINLPDLTQESASSLETAFKTEYNAAKNPNSFSVLKWYSRNILNRFITSQSTFDREIGADLKLTLGRVHKERCIMVTSRLGKDNKMRTTIDLMQASNECHNGDDKTIAAYNISSGMFLSSLEGSALTGEDKISYLDLWAMATADTSLIFVMDDSELRSMTLEAMKAEGGYPAQLLDTIENTEKVIITTDKPILYKGEERWAWLEIDNKTYEIISVFDTGEHAGMAEYTFALKPSLEDAGKYIVGAFIGVDVAVWSVASSSLKLDNYEDIIKDAMANASAIGEYLNKVMTVYDAITSGGLSLLSAGGNAPININFKVKWSLSINIEMAQNIIGFQQGFEDGLSVYFTYARYKKN